MYPNAQQFKLFLDSKTIFLSANSMALRTIVTKSCNSDTATFRWGPKDIVARTFDVTGLAMNAVGEVYLKFGCGFLCEHFIYTRRAESCARMIPSWIAFVVTNVGVANFEMRNLMFIVNGSCIKNGSEFVHEKFIFWMYFWFACFEP
jgi:hypothetical protein